MNKCMTIICVGLLTLGNAVADSPATTIDTSEPLQISSTELTIHQDLGTALFLGKVTVVQGTLRLTSTLLLVEYLIVDGQISSTMKTVTAKGNVLLITDTQDAEADEMVFDVLLNTTTMNGNVSIKQKERRKIK
jgi:lipopolysaccharide transport protein LptA